MPQTKRKSDTVYIRHIQTLNLPFRFHTMHQTTEDLALLDSRATENFIDEEVWKTLNIGCFRLDKPLMVHNVDGTENKTGKIEYYCWFKVIHQGRSVRMRFFLTGLGKDHFILGYPFLFIFNLDVDWRRTLLRGGDVRLEMVGFHRAQQRVDYWQEEAQKCVGFLAEDEEIWMHKMTTVQQWAHAACKEKGAEPLQELPEEYRQHVVVFDEMKATRFPPK
jgi:hypothetical protein